MHTQRLRNKVLLLSVSLCLHAGLLAVLGTIRVLAPSAPPPPLVAVRLETAPPPLETRSKNAVLGALEEHQEVFDEAALADRMPKQDPTTVAIPPAVPIQRGPWSLLEGDGFGAGDRSLVERALADLVQPGAGRRGAFEGTVYRFRSIRAVRADTRWLDGKDRTREEGKVYTYTGHLPGRPPIDRKTPRPWSAVDYHAAVQWPAEWAGRYRFRLTAADGAIFQMDGKDVVNHDAHRGFSPKEGETEIQPGRRTFRLTYLINPKQHLGLILHYHRIGQQGWQVFDLRPLLVHQALRLADPTATATRTERNPATP